jgi:hypothetical protein
VMRKNDLISKIGDILERYQFSTNGSLWNRDYADFIDVIDLQISKSKDTFTVNVGVADKFVVRNCWDLDNSFMVEEPLCTVRVRLGELLCGRDVWWNFSDDNGVRQVLSSIQDVAVPFLQKNHDIDKMIESLEGDPAAVRYPPGNVYLALLYYRKGESVRSREMLRSMKLSSAWKQKVSGIIDTLT